MDRGRCAVVRTVVVFDGGVAAGVEEGPQHEQAQEGDVASLDRALDVDQRQVVLLGEGLEVDVATRVLLAMVVVVDYLFAVTETYKGGLPVNFGHRSSYHGSGVFLP